MTSGDCSIGASPGGVYGFKMLERIKKSKFLIMQVCVVCYLFHSTANLDNMISLYNTIFMFF
jgi:hypothetical protein